MSKILTILIFILTINLSSYCQSRVYIGTQEYLTIENLWQFESLSVNFAKNSTSTGIIIVTAPENEYYRETIGNTLYIYLTNGKQLILSNRIATDHVDGNTSAAFSVGREYLNLLKTDDIQKIRYSITSQYGKIRNQTVLNELKEYKTIELPVLNGESMDGMERLTKNIKSRTTRYYDSLWKDYRSKTEYYQEMTITKNIISIPTASEIKNLYY